MSDTQQVGHVSTDEEDENDPDIEVAPGTEVDVPPEVEQEFNAMLDDYEQELREQLGEQFAHAEDVDYPDDQDIE